MFEGKSIAVVIPAYNEALLIKQTLLSIPEFVDYICVVDDASSDQTVLEIEQISTPKIRLIQHKSNAGVGAAIISGYRECLRLDVDVVAVMGADAQMDPADLQRVVTPVVQNRADYCKGDRLSWKGVQKVMPIARFLANHVLSVFTRLTSGYGDVRDSQCGYTAISKEVLGRLQLSRIYPRYGFPNDILAHLFTIRARLAQVTVRPLYGAETSGITFGTAMFKVPLVLLRSLIYRLRNKPPRLPSVSSTTAERA